MMTINNLRASRSGRVSIGSIAVMTIIAIVGCDDKAPHSPDAVIANAGEKADPVDSGRSIYLHGQSPTGQVISARIGDGPELPATTLACIQCHGPDAHGRPEGGVTPSDIRWENLTRPRSIAEPGGRQHPAYTEALLARAITMGWDPAGQSLSAAMPRYKMAPQDMAELIAYIQHLETAPVPGVTDLSIRIGLALPDDSEESPRTEIVRTVSEYLQSVNQSGTIFQRRLELAVLENDQANDQDIFAALSGLTVDGDPRSERLEAAHIPSVRLYPAPSRLRPNDFRESLVLFSGQVGQVRALAKFALERQIGFESGMAVLHGSRDRAQSLAREVAGQFRAAGAKMVLVDTLSSSEAEIVLLARRLREQRINTILLAGAVDSISLNQLVPLLADQMEPLTILAPAVVATRWMRADPLEPYVRVLVASPVSSRIGTSTLAVVAAARLLVEGLKEAGRDLDRETFIKAMERASYPSAHDSIQIAFGSGRRIGVRGASILRLDRDGMKLEVVSRRIDPGPGTDDWPEYTGRPEP